MTGSPSSDHMSPLGAGVWWPQQRFLPGGGGFYSVLLGSWTCSDPNWNLPGPKLEPARTPTATCSDTEWNLLGPRLEPCRTQTGTCLDPDWNLPGPRLEPAWTPNGTCPDPDWNLPGPRLEPSWTQTGTRPDPDWNVPVLNQICEEEGGLEYWNGGGGYIQGKPGVREVWPALTITWITAPPHHHPQYEWRASQEWQQARNIPAFL